MPVCCMGLDQITIPRLRECCRQIEKNIWFGLTFMCLLLSSMAMTLSWNRQYWSKVGGSAKAIAQSIDDLAMKLKYHLLRYNLGELKKFCYSYNICMSDVYAAYELRRHISLKIISFHRYSMNLDATYVFLFFYVAMGPTWSTVHCLILTEEVQVSDIPRATFAACMD